MLSSENFVEVFFTPSGFKSPGFDAARGRGFLLEQIERHMAQHHKVLLAMVFAHAARILLKGHVEHPMQAIFDAPMAPHSCAKGSRIPRQTRDVIATFFGHLLTDAPLRLDHAHTAQPYPGLLGIEIGDALRIGNGPLLAVFQPSVCFVHAVMRVMH